jgi:PadR family transcriptional regulator PadR
MEKVLKCSFWFGLWLQEENKDRLYLVLSQSFYIPLAYREELKYHALGNREEAMSKPSDLVQGTLGLLILKILALESLNGWAISHRLKQVSGDVLQVSDGSLYPALHKLEQEGCIKAEWKPSENNRRAKYYSLTPLGRQELERESANWRRLAAAISLVVELKGT